VHVNIWILGQMTVESGSRRTQFGGASGMQSALLAALLAAEGRTMSAEALVEELWGEQQPHTVRNALQANISRLRRKLQSVESRTSGPQLLSHAGGYRLDLNGSRVDARTFSEVLTAVHANRSMPPADVSRRLRGALSLWHGPVYGGAAVGIAAQAAAAQLVANRTTALELLFDNELKLGLHSKIVPELTALVRTETLNERWCGQLMIALYRCGRQTEALNAYRRLRHKLNDELGIDPSPMLRNHERAILAHDEELLVRADQPGPRDRMS
jgi:DNA-binding SARP family transcriptional activator